MEFRAAFPMSLALARPTKGLPIKRMDQSTDKSLKCGVCQKPVEGMNPQIRIDGKLVCSNGCLLAVSGTPGNHHLDIHWQDLALPATQADEIVSRLRVVPSHLLSKPPAWLAERLRVEQIVVGCSPLAQRLFSLVSDIITLSRRNYCIVSLKTLAETLGAKHEATIDARDELIDAGALNVHLLRKPS